MGNRGRLRYPGVLTPREQDVLALIRDGLTNEQIAERLNIGFETAKSHVAEILSKLGVATREEAAVWQAEAKRRGPFGRSVLGVPAVGIVAAAVAGLALLAWGLSRSGQGDDGSAAVATGTPTRAAVLVPSSSASPSTTATPLDINVYNPLRQASWMADANDGWVAGASRGGCQEYSLGCVGLIFHTADGGKTWEKQYGGEVLVTAIDSNGKQLAMAIGPTGVCNRGNCPSAVLRTTDGGSHWDEATRTPLELSQISFYGDDAWVLAQGCTQQSQAGCSWQIFDSGDGGGTWTTLPTPVSGFAADLSRPTASDAWMVISPSGPGTSPVIVTHDAGRTWQELPTPENGAGFERRIFFLSATEGWLVVAGQPGAGSQYKEVFLTTDGGQSWTHLAGSLAPVGSNLPDSPGQGIPTSGYLGQLLFTSDTDGWMASPRGGILHTSDGGKNWSVSLVDEEGNLSAVQFTDAQHGYALSLIAFRTTDDGGSTWHAITPLDSLRPNPACSAC